MRRRYFFLICALLLSVMAGAGVRAASQPDTDGVSVSLPDVEFVVYQFQDPYQGLITQPAEPDAQKRYVGAEVAVINHSYFPVSVNLNNIRIRDSDGNEYSAGSVLGEDIRLNARTLAELDLARGWVWFALPLDAQIDQIVFIPSGFEMRISSDQLSIDATPVATPGI